MSHLYVRRAGVAVMALMTIIVAPGIPARLSAQSDQSRLTAADRIDIQQLVARYSYALDHRLSDGRMFAELFVPDGVLVTLEGTFAGQSNLALVSTARTAGPSRTTLTTNLLLEGSRDRARGKIYVIEIGEGATGGPGILSIGGHFEDEYVKTAEGWRFVRREFFPSRLE